MCNESALTGEAMPVQKYQCPNENQRYSSTSHAGSRHTLYAGTTLLQAGSRPQDEVLAVVSATGPPLLKFCGCLWRVQRASTLQRSTHPEFRDSLSVSMSLLISRQAHQRKSDLVGQFKSQSIHTFYPKRTRLLRLLSRTVACTGMSTSKGDLLSAILYPQRMIFK